MFRNGVLAASVLVIGSVAFVPVVFAQGDMTASQLNAPIQGDTASQFIQNLADKALNSIAGKKLSDQETTDRFRTLLHEGFDLKTIGRFALGSYFNVATPEQREAYQSAFEDMIVDAYAVRFREYEGGSFKTIRETPQGEKDTLVESQIGQPNGAPPVNVTWRVRKGPEGFHIIDVAVEGISMSQTERSEFAALIDRNGGQVQALVDALHNHMVGLKANDQ